MMSDIFQTESFWKVAKIYYLGNQINRSWHVLSRLSSTMKFTFDTLSLHVFYFIFPLVKLHEKIIPIQFNSFPFKLKQTREHLINPPQTKLVQLWTLKTRPRHCQLINLRQKNVLQILSMALNLLHTVLLSSQPSSPSVLFWCNPLTSTSVPYYLSLISASEMYHILQLVTAPKGPHCACCSSTGAGEGIGNGTEGRTEWEKDGSAISGSKREISVCDEEEEIRIGMNGKGAKAGLRSVKL